MYLASGGQAGFVSRNGVKLCVPGPSQTMLFRFDPSNAKMAAKEPDNANTVDVMLGNLEDAVAADKKLDAREGFIKIAKEVDFGDTQLLTRVFIV